MASDEIVWQVINNQCTVPQPLQEPTVKAFQLTVNASLFI